MSLIIFTSFFITMSQGYILSLQWRPFIFFSRQKQSENKLSTQEFFLEGLKDMFAPTHPTSQSRGQVTPSAPLFRRHRYHAWEICGVPSDIPYISHPKKPGLVYCLIARAPLGYWAERPPLGGGQIRPPPLPNSRTDGRGGTREAAIESSRWELFKHILFLI